MPGIPFPRWRRTDRVLAVQETSASMRRCCRLSADVVSAPRERLEGLDGLVIGRQSTHSSA